MSQGSINQPQQQHAGIEGVLAALQAVKQFYGIDTEKQQQQLLAAKLPAEQAKALADTAMEKSRLSYYQDPEGGDAPTQTAEGGATSPSASSPLADAIKTPKPSSAKMVPPEILAMQKNQLEIHNLETAGKKGDLELGALPQKIAAEKNKPVTEAGSEFYKVAEKEINGNKFADQARKSLAQGGAIPGKAAIAAIEQMGNDFNRVSVESGQDLKKPIGMLAKLKEAIAEGKEQNLTAETRAGFSNLLNIYDQVNKDALTRKALGVATVHAPSTGMEVPALQQKLLAIASPAPTAKQSSDGVDSPLISHVTKSKGGSGTQTKEEMVPVIGPGGIPGKIPKSKLEAAIGTKKFKLIGTDNAKTAANP